jgi:Fe2+ or Zn2+ uptake regulation protein
MEELLRQHGLKATPARLAILAVFNKNNTPLSAERVYKELQQNRTKINEATVYRTLTSLLEAKILKRIDLQKDAASFELAAHHHHHITCTRCDRIEDFESSTVEKALLEIARRSSHFISIGDHSVELFGICKKCS